MENNACVLFEQKLISRTTLTVDTDNELNSFQLFLFIKAWEHILITQLQWFQGPIAIILTVQY